MKYTPIKENHLFGKAYAKGKRSSGRYITVYILPDYAAARLKKAHPMKRFVNRIGITTSKKIGGAVVRSRVRRIIREGYYAVAREGALRTGKLIVISARSAAADAKSTDIARELRRAFAALGMISGDRDSGV